MAAPSKTVTAAPVVRLPRQDRSREVWQRVLDAGVGVLAESGVARFSVSRVCQRARVAVTAVYSRVDSREELLHAVYEHGVTAVHITQRRLADDVTRPGASAAVELLIEVFRQHGAFLHAAVLGADADAYLAARGPENLALARQVFLDVATGTENSATARRHAQTLFTAVFSTLAFETAFGAHLVHATALDDTRSELRLLAAALFPEPATDR